MRGLKSPTNIEVKDQLHVASYADAWIEIAVEPSYFESRVSRILRGCVD